MKRVFAAIAVMLLAGTGAVSAQDDSMIPRGDSLVLLPQPTEGAIDFSDPTLPEGWRLETINDGGYENGELRAKPVNGTVMLSYDGGLGDFDLAFDCGFGVAEWGTQCEVVFVFTDKTEFRFYHGNKPRQYGDNTVVWLGTADSLKRMPLAGSAARYFFNRRTNIYASTETFYVTVVNKADGQPIAEFEAPSPSKFAGLERVTIVVHNTTGNAKAWLDNLDYYFE